MLTLLKPPGTHLPPVDVAETADETGRILSRVFKTLEHAGIPYCVLHGYENFSGNITSDVDCVIDANTSAHDLLALFLRHRDTIGAEVARCMDYYFVLAGRNADQSLCFLSLDFATGCDPNDLPLYDSDEILATCRRHDTCYIPAADVEFGAYVARTIAKKTLDDGRAQRLSKMFRRDPERCAAQIGRHWTGVNAEIVVAAASSGDWTAVRGQLANLHGELRRRAIGRRPLRFAGNKLRGLHARVRRLLRPDGVSVVLLGPDGAGKSSVIDAIGAELASVFPRWTCRGFAPGLLSLFRRGKRSTSEPHGLLPRSPVISLVRLAYWLAFHVFSFLTLRLALARSTLVLYDRHFVDILVDQKRYRYGGPAGLLRLVWRLIPKPDLIVLLDAPAEILQARKQEVPFEVTVRQRESYLALVRTLPNGHIVDASLSHARVVNNVSGVILKWAAERIARRET